MQAMNVDELRAALADLPGEAVVKVWYEGRTVSSDELTVLGAHVDADGVLYAFLDTDSGDQPLHVSPRSGFLS